MAECEPSHLTLHSDRFIIEDLDPHWTRKARYGENSTLFTDFK